MNKINERELTMKQQLQQNNPICDLDLEKEIISCLFNNRDAIDNVIDKMNTKYFYNDEHRQIYHTCIEMWRRRMEISEVNAPAVYKELYSKPMKISTLSDITTTYLGSLPVTIDAIKQLKNLYIKRMIKLGAMAILSDINTVKVDDAINDMAKMLTDVQDEFLDNAERPFDNIAEVIAHDLEMAQHGDNEWRVYSGITRLDVNAIKGFRKKRLYIICGDAGNGKTTFVNNIAVGAIDKGAAVLFFTLDESNSSLGKTVLGITTRTNISDIDAGFIEYETVNTSKLTECIKRFARIGESLKRFYIRDDMYGILQIEAEIKRMKRRSNIDVVIVDYATLVVGESDDQLNEIEKQKNIIERLKRIGRKQDVVMIVLSQLTKAEGVPTLKKMYGAGAMGHAPDVVLSVEKDGDIQEIDATNASITDVTIRVLKNKKGRVGKIKARWLLEYGIMTNPEDNRTEQRYVTGSQAREPEPDYIQQRWESRGHDVVRSSKLQ